MINTAAIRERTNNNIGKKILFMIGIDKYPNFNPLFNATKDVWDISSILTNKFGFDDDSSIILENEEATFEKIIETFKLLITNTKEEDSLLIYYAGHGFYDNSEKMGYWLPCDAVQLRYTTFLPNERIISIIKKIKAKHIILISDSCFSRSLLLTDNQRRINEYANEKSRWSLTSGKGLVSDGTPNTNSPFATSIINYLNKQDKEFLISDLIQNVKRTVSENYDQNPQGYPISGVGHDGGEFVFKLSDEDIQEEEKSGIKENKDIINILKQYAKGSKLTDKGNIVDRKLNVGYNLFLITDTLYFSEKYCLYFYSGFTQKNAYKVFYSNHPEIIDKVNSLVIILPKENKDSKWLETKRKKMQALFKHKPKSVIFLNEFVWKYCTPMGFSDNERVEFSYVDNFIEPLIKDDENKEIAFKQLKEWTNDGIEQILALKGSGGIGKTTIAEYLCDHFHMMNKDAKVIFIRSSNIIDELNKVSDKTDTINIYSFYEAEVSKSELSETLTIEQFKLNFDNGNIFIIIDGLDEVISKVKRFNIDEFLISIFDFTNEVKNGKLLLTCRDYFWDNNLFGKNIIESIKTLEILPFDNKRAEIFFQQSFKSETKAKNALKLTKKFNKNQEEFNPLVLDLIKQLIQYEDDEIEYEFNKHSIYLNNIFTNDCIIYSICHRETYKLDQISEDEQLKFFIHFSIYQVSVEKLKETMLEVVGKEINNTNIEAFKSHLLLIYENNSIRFKYDFLSEYFKSIYVSSYISSDYFKEISKELIILLSENYSYTSALIKEVSERLLVLNDDIILRFYDILFAVKESGYLDDRQKRKAISSIFSIALATVKRIYGNNKAQNTQILIELFGFKDNIIKDISVIGLYDETIFLNFEGLTFENCYFDSFTNFWSCNLTQSTYFNNCVLKNLRNYQNERINIPRANFNAECEIDEDFKSVFRDGEQESKTQKQQVRDFFLFFTNLFFTKGHLERQSLDNVIRKRFPFITPKLYKFEDFISILEELNFIELNKNKANETIVEICIDFKKDIVQYKNNKIVSAKLQKIIDKLAKRA